MSDTNTPRPPGIGTAVILTRGNRVLLGYRTSRVNANIWACPGGKLDFGETVEQCARRETWEETRISAQGSYTPLGWEDDFIPEHNLQFVTLYVHIDDTGNSQEAQIPEEEKLKCSELRWFTLEELTDLPIWPSTLPYIQRVLQGLNG